MNSRTIYDFIRPKLGSTQKQYDALLRMLNSGTRVEDIAEFVGMSIENVDQMQQGKIDSTGNFKLSERSLSRLTGVHPDLVKVVEAAIRISPIQFQVGEGLRTAARQKELMASGATQTLNSRHLTGHAVDLFAYPEGKLSWDWKYYYQIEEAVKQAAHNLKIPIEWGGDWRSFKDGPHWQLPWNKYPK